MQACASAWIERRCLCGCCVDVCGFCVGCLVGGWLVVVYLLCCLVWVCLLWGGCGRVGGGVVCVGGGGGR